ncbi:MAG: exosortase [Alphaproteobacteria bacterium]|nr:exosortase [Alphaproteobacteria bacterium]
MTGLAAVFRNRRNYIALLFLLLVLFVSWFESVAQLADLVWKADIYNHGVWVPVVSLWLMFRSWERVTDSGLSFWWPAALGILVASALWLIGGAAEASILQHFSLVTAIQFIVVGCLGPRAYRLILFPMLFLFAAIPLGQQLVEPLQNLTAKMVIGALGMSGMEFEADGVLIKLSSGYYQIARACAGVKFLNSSLVLGVLLCHLTFSSWKRRSVMMLAAVIVPIFFNAVRVYGTLLLGEMTDASFAKGVDHIVYGWGFLSFILILLIAGAYRFSDRENEQEPNSCKLAVERQNSSTPALILLAAGFLPALAGMWLPGSNLSVPMCLTPTLAPPKCMECGFRQLMPDVATRWIHEAEADLRQAWYFREDAATVMGKTFLYWPDRLGHRLVGATSLLLDDGWQLLGGIDTHPVDVGKAAFEESVIWRQGERRLMWRTYVIGGKHYAHNIDAKLHLAWLRLSGRPAIGQSLVIATDLTSTIEDARIILNRFFVSHPPEALLWPSGEQSWDQGLCAE